MFILFTFVWWDVGSGCTFLFHSPLSQQVCGRQRNRVPRYNSALIPDPGVCWDDDTNCFLDDPTSSPGYESTANRSNTDTWAVTKTSYFALEPTTTSLFHPSCWKWNANGTGTPFLFCHHRWLRSISALVFWLDLLKCLPHHNIDIMMEATWNECWWDVIAKNI